MKFIIIFLKLMKKCLRMIDRFRYSKPIQQDQREKTKFWWNEESCGNSKSQFFFFKCHLFKF